MRYRTLGAGFVAVVAVAVVASTGCGGGTLPTTTSEDAGQGPGSNHKPQPRPKPDAGPDEEALPASLSGQVTLLGSSSNAGARVAVTTKSSIATTLTDSNGSYLLDALPAGAFSVVFSSPGYQSQDQTGILAPGDSAQASATLEHSRLVAALGGLPEGGAFLGYAQWIPLADGGREGGTQLFYLDPLILAAVDADAGARVLERADGGLRFVGFDREGGAIAEHIEGDATEIEFADQGLVTSRWLGTGVSRVVPMGDSVFFGTFAANNENDWSELGRDDLGPTPLARGVATRTPPAVLAGQKDEQKNGQQDGQMAGWVIGADGYDTPVVFAPEHSHPISVCTQGTTPLQASLDGERFAFAVLPKPGDGIGLGAPPVDLESCAQSVAPQVFVSGSTMMQVSDATFAGGNAIVYPLSDDSYAGEVPNADGTRHLFVHEAEQVSWKSEWEGDVEGWAPLHGPNLLIARFEDGGRALEVVGAAAIDGSLSTSAAIPFAHEWALPLCLSDDNRFVILEGIGALFDLEKQIEIPLVVTPVFAQFNRLATAVLLLDAGGRMALLWLGGSASDAPQGQLLEGSALVASFTPDEQAVVYAGSDPLGNTGLFAEPLPKAPVF